MIGDETCAGPGVTAGAFPVPNAQHRLIRLVFVMARLGVGPDEANVRLLARQLPRDRYSITVIPCFRDQRTSPRTHEQLGSLGVNVDTTPYDLGFEDTVDHLRRKLVQADVVVSCQNVADIYPALEGMAVRPPLIEYGARVGDALAGPKHLTARYVGHGNGIRAAAASKMPGRSDDAVVIPPMVDPQEFRPERRGPVRAALGIAPDDLLIGWVGRPDCGAGVQDFIAAALRIAGSVPNARFVAVGVPDPLVPEDAQQLRLLARPLGRRMIFAGDGWDMLDLLGAMDLLCCLPQDGETAHVLGHAGAAALPVIAVADHGADQQIAEGTTGLLVPAGDAGALDQAIMRLLGDAPLRNRLGAALRDHVLARNAARVVVPQWQALIDRVLAERAPAPPPATFNSFVLGGWESSTHRLRSGQRLDVIASTGHDTHTAQDYRQLSGLGIRACRDGARWHLIEQRPRRYDFSSLTGMIEAARDTGTQVIWDLLHYGWPDDLDIWAPAFVDRFAAYARAVALHHRETTDAVPFWCPVNEISFFSWAGGDVRYLNPFAAGRGFELKCQLARASIAAMGELRAVDPRARFVQAEPLLAIHHDPQGGDPTSVAQGHHEAQFQAFDMISGRIWPQLGGEPAFLDIVGVNYYWNNQWIHGGPAIDMDHPAYRPLADLLFEVAARYDRPLMIAETGTEGARRASWFAYIRDQVDGARRRGVRIEGVCLYPVANHHGWDDDRLCPNGLLGQDPTGGARSVEWPLAREIMLRNNGLG